jgi:hypothetical protein
MTISAMKLDVTIGHINAIVSNAEKTKHKIDGQLIDAIREGKDVLGALEKQRHIDGRGGKIDITA